MRLSHFAAALLASTLAAHADTIVTTNITGVFENGSTLSGTITIDDTTGTVQSGNLFVNTGAISTHFGPNPVDERNQSDLHIFDFFDAGNDDLSLSVSGSSIHTGFMLCSETYACDGGTSALEFSTGGFTSLQSESSLAATPEPSSLLLLGTGALGMAGAVRRRFFPRA